MIESIVFVAWLVGLLSVVAVAVGLAVGLIVVACLAAARAARAVRAGWRRAVDALMGANIN